MRENRDLTRRGPEFSLRNDPCLTHVPGGIVGVIGVIDMELLSVIRRWHHREHMPICEIERRTGLSRVTIRKYLRSNTVEVKFKVPERPSHLDPYADKLTAWLRVEAGKGRKVRRNARRLHADLVVLGYDGSYARVAAFIRQWRAGREIAQRTTGRGVFVPLVFQPGEAFQFDWSEDWAMVAGKRVKLQAAHTKLSHSKAFVIRAYRLQTHEMLSTLWQRRSVCWAACPAAASSTTCGQPWIGSVSARLGRSTRASRRWPATTCSNQRSAPPLRAERRVRL